MLVILEAMPTQIVLFFYEEKALVYFYLVKIMWNKCLITICILIIFKIES